MSKYFTNCKTAEEVKREYKELAKKLHPDNGGSTAAFQEMQAEFSEAFERLKNIHVNADGEQYTKETTETAAEFMELINKLLNLPGVVIELCGSWIWITGNTRECKEQLKKFGFKWSHNKNAWYFHRDPYRKHGKKTYDLDTIRAMYGSKKFNNSGRQEPEFLPV